MNAAYAVFFLLFAWRASGFWSYLLRGPSVLDGTSLRLLISFGLWPLAMAIFLWAAAYGLGRRALRALGAPTTSALDDVSAAALGLGLLGQAVFCLGWGGVLQAAPLAALLAVAAAFAAGGLSLPKVRRLDLDLWTGCAAGLLAFAAAVALLSALAPAIDWDVRAYHLALPELYLQAGRLIPLPWLLHSHWPHLMEVLYSLPLAFGRDEAAALLHFGCAVLLVGGVFLSARRASGPTAGWAAALLLSAQPALLRVAGAAHCDAAAALFAFSASHALSRWDETRRTRWLAAAGLLAGLGGATKLTLLALLGGWALWLALARRRPRAAALFLGCGLLMAGPWLLKVWLETGDPVWPFLSRADPAVAALAARGSARWTFPPPAWLLLKDGPGFLLLPLAALWLLSPARRAKAGPEERWLWSASPVFVLLVLREGEAWRYLMPLWPAATLMAGRLAAACWTRRETRRVAAALIAAGAAPILLCSPNNELFAVLAPRPRSAPETDRRAHFENLSLQGLPDFYRESRAVLPAGAKVLLWREIRGYGAGFDYLWGDPMNQALLDYRRIPDPEALAARMKFLGVTHILSHPASHLYQEDPGYYDHRTLLLMEECLRTHARPVIARDGFLLHQLL